MKLEIRLINKWDDPREQEILQSQYCKGLRNAGWLCPFYLYKSERAPEHCQAMLQAKPPHCII